MFKMLYHSSLKLNVVNLLRSLRNWSPTEPTEGFTENPGTQLCFISQFMENAEFFSFLANALETLCYSKKRNLTCWEKTSIMFFQKKKTGIFRYLSTLPLEIPGKIKLHSWKFCKFVLHPLGILKPRAI